MTPNAPVPRRPSAGAAARPIVTPRSAIRQRVLITTVPFGQADRQPIDLLEAEGVEYVINPLGRRLREDELEQMIGEFGVLIAGTEPITARVIRTAIHLSLISRVGIGVDNVDLGEARRRGIHLTYTPEAPSSAVAELTIGLMLSLLRNIPGADRKMRNGVWQRFMGQRLSRMTVGVIGVGRIGKRVIQHLAGGFPGARILANDLQPDLEFGRRAGVHWVDKEQIYREADLLTLHVPLTSETRNLISAREIGWMRPGAALINTSRGSIVNERDLAEALRAERLGGAAIDVFEREPYSGELTTLDRCILTCHMGSMSEDCRARMEMEATEEVIRFLRNEPLQRLVPESEYVLARVGG